VSAGVATLWFRQWRLELWYDKNIGTDYDYRRKREKSYGVAYGIENSKTPVAFISGGWSNWSGHLFQAVTTPLVANPSSYQRTVGITDSTSSSDNFAVFTRITGTLADRLSGSANLHTFYKFLNNPFGTPYIPLSSGSGENSFLEILNDVDSNNRIISEIFRPQALVGSSYTLRSSLSSKDITLQTRDIIAEKVESGTSGSV
jgi:hypothetical protein